MESSELLTILEQLERDKGIKKQILIEAVEAAVASAAKKLWTVDEEEEALRCVLAQHTRVFRKVKEWLTRPACWRCVGLDSRKGSSASLAPALA